MGRSLRINIKIGDIIQSTKQFKLQFMSLFRSDSVKMVVCCIQFVDLYEFLESLYTPSKTVYNTITVYKTVDLIVYFW